jgi:hypothetical protein
MVFLDQLRSPRGISARSKDSPCARSLSREAIQFSGICRTKLYEEIASGSLVARKAGRKTLILADDLETFLGNLPILNTGKRRSAEAA